VRTLPDCVADAQIASRGLFHTFPAGETGLARDLQVPLAPFRFGHGGPKAETPPRPAGADSAAILNELGFSGADVQRLRARGVI
jgi:crotonobetainyl-CoA:carnitine CoA-transferase CaiB-like acyl-CoA transferase